MRKVNYHNYIEAAVIEARKQHDKQVESWRGRFRPDEFLGMYAPPEFVSFRVQIEGYMYQQTKDRSYAEEVKRLLLALEDYKSIVPEAIRQRHPEYAEGIPAFEPMFQGAHFLHGYLDVADSGVFDALQKKQIEEAIRSMVRVVFHFPEWGAHNRSMLRAQALSLAIAALGETSETQEWARLRDYLAEASIANWSIEDAELYIPLWLMSCMIVAEQTGTEREYYALPQTKYYFDYIVSLLTPYGQLPDFGDSHHNSSWNLWHAILEKGAAVYRCGHMKYAAGLIYEYGTHNMDSAPNAYNAAYTAAYLTLAHRWSDDTVEPLQPQWRSREVLEDLIGKKLVFRKGWDKDADYMLLTYRDEGAYARVTRDYMRLTVNAPAEKVHHGHADENSISLLASRRAVLLHDGGYRDGAPNGKYRADLYHNRLVFRNSKPAPGASMYDFLHDDGHYHRVSSEKLHFQSFGDIVFSRTRVKDPFRGFLWDRALVYLPEEEVYIVIDWAEALADGERTIANVWHPGRILEAGDGYYSGQVPHIFLKPHDPIPRPNRKDMALLIEFAGSARSNSYETIRRCYTTSEMVYEWDSSVRKAGDRVGFVTVLTPFAYAPGATVPKGRVTSVQFEQNHSQLTLKYQHLKHRLTCCVKLDAGLGRLDTAEYPKYSYESGRLVYGGSITTDADFAFVSEGEEGAGRYGYLNGCGIEYNGSILHRTPQMSGYSFNEKRYWPADHRWRAWDGSFRH